MKFFLLSTLSAIVLTTTACQQKEDKDDLRTTQYNGSDWVVNCTSKEINHGGTWRSRDTMNYTGDPAFEEKSIAIFDAIYGSACD